MFYAIQPISDTCDKRFCTKDAARQILLFRHLPDMLGIDSRKYYIGACCTTYLFYIENKSFTSISYLYSDCSEAWFVVLAVDKR